VERIASKYRNTGQTCVCTNRALVQDSVYDAFMENGNGGEEVEAGAAAPGFQKPLIDNAAGESGEPLRMRF
jgi:succinate-semialdehyde dehydrogenase/glutarate-semialdehyde dehydrogenase